MLRCAGVHERVRPAGGLRRAALQGAPLQRIRFRRTLRVCLAVYSRVGWQVSGEGEEKYLIATSEQTLCSMLRHKWIDPKACPMRLAGYSTCFRKEVRAQRFARAASVLAAPVLWWLSETSRDAPPGWLARPRHAGHLPRAPVREGGAVLRHRCAAAASGWHVSASDPRLRGPCTVPDGDESWKMQEEMLKNSEEFYQVCFVFGALRGASLTLLDTGARPAVPRG